jgi:hypothetical protein
MTVFGGRRAPEGRIVLRFGYDDAHGFGEFLIKEISTQG